MYRVAEALHERSEEEAMAFTALDHEQQLYWKRLARAAISEIRSITSDALGVTSND